MSFIYYFFVFLFLLLCILLSFTILIQESRSLGFGASFGGDPSASLFGTSTADVLRKFTAYLIAIFLAACIILSLWTSTIGRYRIAPIPTEIEEMQNNR